MAKKISELDPAAAITGAESVPVVQQNQTVRTTVSALVAGAPPATHNLFSSSHPDMDAADVPANGELLRYDSTVSKWRASPSLSTINLIVGQAGAKITNGAKQPVKLDFACTIQSVELLADASGSVTVDIKRATYAGLPSFTSLVGAGVKPSLASAQKSQDTDLSDWSDTSLDAGDWLQVEISGADGVLEVLTIALKARRD